MAEPCDLLVIGGGINGAGIARDAAGRGLGVILVEKDDLAAHTSSASTKLIHGGLRYLEYYDFRLVREALIERERLLGIAPHLIYPLTFVMPLPPGGRPAWLIRIGLFLYDHIGGKRTLAGSRRAKLAGTPLGAPLKAHVTRGFTYSDGWVDDARLVTLNAVDARRRGAEILTRTAFVSARREGERWRATLRGDDGGVRVVTPRAIVNAAGAWVGRVLGDVGGVTAERPPRLVKGSHIVVPRLYEGDHAYILQNEDGRIVFAIPYEGAFTLIGTTDVPEASPDAAPAITPEETDYLLASVNAYFSRAVTADEIVWSYSGVRPLHDDGRANAAAVTRDYVLSLDADGPPLLSVFGGKITTYRRLAEHALEKLTPHLPMPGAWTATGPLPGGDIADFGTFLAETRARYPFLGDALSLRLARAYGTMLPGILGDARDMAAIGPDFGGGLTRAEVDHLVAHEYARDADDILWRRTKLGLHTGAATRAALIAHLAA